MLHLDEALRANRKIKDNNYYMENRENIKQKRYEKYHLNKKSLMGTSTD